MEARQKSVRFELVERPMYFSLPIVESEPDIEDAFARYLGIQTLEDYIHIYYRQESDANIHDMDLALANALAYLKPERSK